MTRERKNAKQRRVEDEDEAKSLHFLVRVDDEFTGPRFVSKVLPEEGCDYEQGVEVDGECCSDTSCCSAI